MKCLSIIVLITLMSVASISFAAQQHYDAHGDAMGVASSNHQGTAFINPALIALDASKDSGGKLQSLHGERAYTNNVGLGVSFVLPTVKMPMALFYKTYIDAVGVAAVSQIDLDNLNNLDVNGSSTTSELDSQGAVVAGGVSDIGVALSFPLSIVNMPIAVGISPKMQRIDTYNYVVNANNFNVDDADDVRYSYDDTVFNFDIGVAIQPTAGLTLGVSGRNLFNHKQQTIDTLGRQFTYRIESLYTAGLAYDWANLSLTTDIDLNDYQRFDEVASTQYWRFAGELKTADWLALRVGYRHDLNNTTIDLYSVGTGFSIGRTFNLDLTGLFGSDDTIGGVIQTSYHF